METYPYDHLESMGNLPPLASPWRPVKLHQWYTPAEERMGQFSELLKKHFLLAGRSKKFTGAAIFGPFLFLLLLFGLQLIPPDGFGSEEKTPPPTAIGGIPSCSVSRGFCFSLMYAPANNTLVNSVMQHIAQVNKLKIAPWNDNPSSIPSKSIVACDNVQQIIDLMVSNPEVVQAAVDFTPVDIRDHVYMPSLDPEYTFNYNLFYNRSCLKPVASVGCPNLRYALQRSVDEGLAASLTAQGTTISITRQPYPYVQTHVSVVGTTAAVVTQYGILFYYCGVMCVFLVLLLQVVHEKQENLKKGMKLMGLKSSAYWAAWTMYGTVLNTLACLCFLVSGYVFRFHFFTDTSVFVLLTLFWLFGQAMVVFAFFVTMFTNSSKAATIAGMFIFILGVVLALTLTSSDIVAIFFNNASSASIISYYILVFFPPFNLAKGITDIDRYSYLDSDGYIGPGYAWSNIYTPTVTSRNVVLPATVQTFYLLLVNIFAYAILAWYLENILPGQGSHAQPPWFFLTDEYWGFSRRTKPKTIVKGLTRVDEDPATIDIDVLDEDNQSQTPSERNDAVRVVRLSKKYRKLPLGIPSPFDSLAVDNLSICIPKGALFCLLGHNGAGKTTTIDILTGNLRATGGEAYINGHSVATEMNVIRRSMGVCPQHDILWDELSAREHLQLFCALKNVPGHERKSWIDETLEMVQLHKVADHRVSSFSGGMKRRLSVAISSMGNPDIIFLDEPTTGMDPMSRRKVWKLIEELKKDRVIILTTHSMEEADALGDRVGIMAHGKLRCIGNPLHLKHRFGEGYRINIAADVDNMPQVKAIFADYLPEARIVAESGSSLIFGFNTTEYERMIPLFQYLEEQETAEDPLIRDWGVSQTTLEDVFLKVTRQVYSGGNRIELELTHQCQPVN